VIHPAVRHRCGFCLSLTPVPGLLPVPSRPVPPVGACTDWTKSLSERITIWKWASFSARAQCGSGDGSVDSSESVVGINFSDLVYNDADGVSQENGVWENGVVHSVGRVDFELPEPAAQTTAVWRLRSVNPTIDLSFQPRGSREEHLQLGLIASDFVQPYGVFNGKITINHNGQVRCTALRCAALSHPQLTPSRPNPRLVGQDMRNHQCLWRC
jgi:hypothetical protein